MSLPVPLSQGTIIGGHYIVGSLLNSGGFGAVYQGTDTSQGNRSCAIKETYDVTPAARRQALMETSVLLTVRSQHLPEVYDAFEFNGRFYLIMQLIEGQNLLQLLKSRTPGGVVGEAGPNQQSAGPCSEQEVLDWLLPIMDVLQELHSRHPPIMHRDIKPGNLILTPQDTIVLVDFGLTKLYDPSRSTQTMVKAVSAGFSPIEQYVGKTSPQSDIYSMAATMYLLLTNRLPSSAMSRSVSDDLIAPRSLNPSVSPKMERALLQALTVNADQRCQSMDEFARALRAPTFSAYADQTVAVPPPIVQSAMAQAAPMVVATQPASPPQSSYAPVSAMNPTMPVNPPYPYGGAQAAPAPLPEQPSPAKKKGFPPTQQKGQPPQPSNAAYPFLSPRNTSGSGGSALSLPNASRLGRLWGMCLGIGAALIVFFLRGEAGSYLALLLGFIGYLAVGFFTTRRGGSFFRGGIAGYRAGMTSLVLFGVTLGTFLAIAFAQHLHDLTTGSDFYGQHVDIAAQSAWSAVQPVWPNLTILPDQVPFINFVAVLIAIVLVAWVLGLVGGLTGSLQISANAGNQQGQTPHP